MAGTGAGKLYLTAKDKIQEKEARVYMNYINPKGKLEINDSFDSYCNVFFYPFEDDAFCGFGKCVNLLI